MPNTPPFTELGFAPCILLFLYFLWRIFKVMNRGIFLKKERKSLLLETGFMGTIYFYTYSLPFCVTRTTCVFWTCICPRQSGGALYFEMCLQRPFHKAFQSHFSFVTGNLRRRCYLRIGQDQLHLFSISDVVSLAFPISDCLWLLPSPPIPPPFPAPTPHRLPESPRSQEVRHLAMTRCLNYRLLLWDSEQVGQLWVPEYNTNWQQKVE